MPWVSENNFRFSCFYKEENKWENVGNAIFFAVEI
jgi:hypothetical protein